MNKKAISPLIATVLIIGFTIVLAAVILQWAGGFVKNLTTQQEVTVNLQTACMGMDVAITEAKLVSITSNPLTTGELNISIVNNNVEKAVEGALLLIETDSGRITIDDDKNNVNKIPVLGSLTLSNYTTITWDLTDPTKIAKFEINVVGGAKEIKAGDKVILVPKVKVGTETKPCDIGVAATATIE